MMREPAARQGKEEGQPPGQPKRAADEERTRRQQKEFNLTWPEILVAGLVQHDAKED